MNSENNPLENPASAPTKVYEKPAIEIIEMEMEGSILQGSDYAAEGNDYESGGGMPWE